MRLTLWLKRETGAAKLFWLGDPGKLPVPMQLWIPRSVLTYFRKEAPVPGSAYRQCEVELEEWFYEREKEAFEQMQQTKQLTFSEANKGNEAL